MIIEIKGHEENRLRGIIELKAKAREHLAEAIKLDNGQAIKHWGEEMRSLNEQAGTILMRSIDDE